MEFPFENYNVAIVEARERFSSHLYDQARERLALPRKVDARIAYENLEYLLQLNPGYRDAEALLRKAHMKGPDFVLVSLYNESEIAIPVKLEEDLLSFESNQFDTLWTIHHREPSSDVPYGTRYESPFAASSSALNVSWKRRSLRKGALMTDIITPRTNTETS